MEEGDDFAELYAAVGPRLWRTIYVFTGGRPDMADDVVAEAFVRTLERGEGIRDRAAYAYRVAFRLATLELRRPPTFADVPEESAAAVDEDPHDLLAALRQLSPKQRAAVYLRYQVDLPIDEIAHLMATSPAAVRVHLMRGRRRLAELLPEVADV